MVTGEVVKGASVEAARGPRKGGALLSVAALSALQSLGEGQGESSGQFYGHRGLI
jgi:hypothetical protein